MLKSIRFYVIMTDQTFRTSIGAAFVVQSLKARFGSNALIVVLSKFN